MKKAFCCLVISKLIVASAFCQQQQLSQQQKIADFKYLFETMKDNYPYFGVLQRKNGVDWLGKKNEYIERIKKTENDSAYVFTIKSILEELKSGHVNLEPTLYGEQMYYPLYKKITVEMPNYQAWVDVFEDPKAKVQYWARLLKIASLKDLDRESNNTDSTKQSLTHKRCYSDTIVENGKIAVMSIPSFEYNTIEKDKQQIDVFLNEIGNCDYLVIDIQQNGGGATKYWVDNIVKRLIKASVVYSLYPIIKDGELNRCFYSSFFDKAKLLIADHKLPNIPKELLHDKYYITVENDTIVPDNPADFKGKIVLLVDKRVFSSSEGFAQFCKSTKWATVAGERTGGEGIGSDPALILLPESGIVLCYPSLSGLNYDGSLNAEERTIPDIEIKASSAKERLDSLLKYLIDNNK